MGGATVGTEEVGDVVPYPQLLMLSTGMIGMLCGGSARCVREELWLRNNVPSFFPPQEVGDDEDDDDSEGDGVGGEEGADLLPVFAEEVAGPEEEDVPGNGAYEGEDGDGKHFEVHKACHNGDNGAAAEEEPVDEDSEVAVGAEPFTGDLHL